MTTTGQHATTDQPDRAELTRQIFSPVSTELQRVEELLSSELQSDTPLVDELLKYGCLLNGKRMRPALLLLSAKAVGEITDDHITLAAVVEMIHTATLVHDDVLDEATVRRHLATVNARWDNKVSVLLGDYLFTHAFHLASRTGSATACETIGAATNKVCEGELWQIGQRANFDLSEDEYLRIIGAKTAALCGCSSRLGAQFAGASADIVDAFARYGWNLGTAFQIADDLLDLVGDENEIGKSLGTDLEQQKPTLPIIHALSACHGQERQQMLDLLRDAPAAELQSTIGPWLVRHGSIEYARAKALELADSAANELQSLAASPAKEILILLCHLVVHRGQ